MKKKQVFWGCGKIGKEILAFWRDLAISPDFFCDNSPFLWEKDIDNVKILSPKKIYKLKKEITIFITCNQYAAVEKQLLDNGIPEMEIVRADSILAPEMLYRLSDILFQCYLACDDNIFGRYECLIDLSEGMVLGGVEQWSYSLAEILISLEIKGAYLVLGKGKKNVTDNKIPILRAKNRGKMAIVDVIRYIVGSNAKTIICNFPFEIMIGACIVKQYINPELKVIVVVHSDDEIYYRAMQIWEKYIDICLAISEKIKKTLIKQPFPVYKIRDLYWYVPCKGINNRHYSPNGSPIKIGYAGRISLNPKRIDLILQVGEMLKEKHVPFQIELAGSGEYEMDLEKEIWQKNLQDNINFIGTVKHEFIMEFWEKHDICISCSEREGHSISHSEAMAAGTVLVITDTSGARDDVEEGVNGFVVDIGDIDMLVQRIIYLDNHRECLYQMGVRSMEKIIMRNEYMEPKIYWESLLK